MAEIDSNYKFLKIEEIAKNVVEQALDDFLYDGKSIREWMKIIAQEDCISRQAVLDTMSELNAISFYEAQEDSKECYYEIRQAVENMQPVIPQPKMGRWKKMVTVYDMIEGRYRMTPYTHADEELNNTPFYICDCGHNSKKPTKYCPNCGTRMVQESEG